MIFFQAHAHNRMRAPAVGTDKTHQGPPPGKAWQSALIVRESVTIGYSAFNHGILSPHRHRVRTGPQTAEPTERADVPTPSVLPTPLHTQARPGLEDRSS